MSRTISELAMRAAMGIGHDLHEGHIPGCGECLSLKDTQAAREHMAAIIRNELIAAATAPSEVSKALRIVVLEELETAVRRFRNTAIVDDDFPQMRDAVDNLLKKLEVTP